MPANNKLSNKLINQLNEIYSPIFAEISSTLGGIANKSIEISIENIEKFQNLNKFLEQLKDDDFICNFEEYGGRQDLCSLTIISHDASKEIFLEKASQEKIFSEIIKHYNKNDPDSDIKTKEIITGKNELKNKINYPIITINTKLKIDEKEYYLIRVIPEEILMTDKKNKKETDENKTVKGDIIDHEITKDEKYQNTKFDEFPNVIAKEPEQAQTGEQPITVQPVQFPSFDNHLGMKLEGNRNFDLLLDIKLQLTVELGRTEMPIKKILELTRGSIIELDKVAGEPVELYASGKMIAKGEVVVIEDNFGLRIISIVSPDDRIKNL